MTEGSRHFESRSAVFDALRKITAQLDDKKIPYAIAGGMALFLHGYRRFTEVVDLLVTRDSLARIHEALDGLGYLPPFAQSKNLRDTELGVRIEFILTGDYPGDGKPKPVAFPDPQAVTMDRDGFRILNLPTLVQLKLASGMTSPGRLRDLADVLELIKHLQLSADFSRHLSPFVQPKFAELWAAAQEQTEPGG